MKTYRSINQICHNLKLVGERDFSEGLPFLEREWLKQRFKYNNEIDIQINLQ